MSTSETFDNFIGDKLPWAIHHGDCIEEMARMPESCIDFSIFSPPFPQTFAYTNLAEDIGNSEELGNEAKLHFSFFLRQLLRVTKPGRAVVLHCAQIARLKRSGEEGLFDFRGMLIRLAQRTGFTYEYDWLVRKNPQAQALRTKKWELKFQGLETDRAMSRGALGDYLLKFRKPGVNAVKVNEPGEVTRNDWISWAEPCWDDIQETDTLNVAMGRGEDDTRHICPLQLEVSRRCILLYSGPGEVVYSPFTGIGSEGFMALGGVSPKTGKSIGWPRRFYGCEIKNEYYDASIVNMNRAMALAKEKNRTLFDGLDSDTSDTEEVCPFD
jgi:DNA modification methylase